MSEAKKTRPMTPKRFATKVLSAKTTVDGFLSMHRQFLDGYSFLSPILQAYDQKELLPTITLQSVQSALLSHYMLMERNKALTKMAARQEEEAAPTKNYTVSLFCKVFDKGQMSIQVGTIQTRKWVEKESATIPGKMYLEPHMHTKSAVWQATTYGEAERLADRKLFQREDGVYASIQNNHGKTIETFVQRGDSVARVLAPKKQPFSKARGISTKSLDFGVKVSETRNVWHLKNG